MSIRVYNGSKFSTVDKVVAGDIFAVTGITSLSVGDGMGALIGKV